MTVRDLLNELAAVDPDTRVFVDAHEYGLTDPVLRKLPVHLDVATFKCGGPHADAITDEWMVEDAEAKGEAPRVVAGVVLSRKS